MKPPRATALRPALTSVDKRVYDLLRADVGTRASRIGQMVIWKGAPLGTAAAREILRGLEHLGWAEQAGGWWRQK